MKCFSSLRAVGPTLLVLVPALALTHAAGRSATAPNPFAAHALSPAQQFSFEGTVAERLPAGPYVYQRIAGTWVASLAMTTPPAQGLVRVTVLGRTDDFSSKRLQRRFEHLSFGLVRPAR